MPVSYFFNLYFKMLPSFSVRHVLCMTLLPRHLGIAVSGPATVTHFHPSAPPPPYPILSIPLDPSQHYLLEAGVGVREQSEIGKGRKYCPIKLHLNYFLLTVPTSTL